MSEHDIIRRIAERGIARAQASENSEFIDIFQHLLDEIQRCVILPKERTCKTCQIVKVRKPRNEKSTNS